MVFRGRLCRFWIWMGVDIVVILLHPTPELVHAAIQGHQPIQQFPTTVIKQRQCTNQQNATAPPPQIP